MSDITVIGLGAMGSALAQVLVTAKHGVTVWNRSPEKIAPIVGARRRRRGGSERRPSGQSADHDLHRQL